MPVVFWMTRLKPGVQPEDYERWLREFDYANAPKLETILSYRAYRVERPFIEDEKLFDYLEVIEVTNLEKYRKDLEENPAAKAIAAPWGGFLDLVGSLQAEFLPPGFSRIQEINLPDQR
jgi:hypothetical protein